MVRTYRQILLSFTIACLNSICYFFQQTLQHWLKFNTLSDDLQQLLVKVDSNLSEDEPSTLTSSELQGRLGDLRSSGHDLEQCVMTLAGLQESGQQVLASLSPCQAKVKDFMVKIQNL